MPADALIINADDLGLWPSVNEGIFQAWARGAISDSTVFANAPGLPAILAQAHTVGLPVGIHLNLTHGAPLCDPADIPALVTPQGLFMKRQAWSLPLPEEQVRRELQAQVARVQALGCQPSHLDSHHHIHQYPEILTVVIELAHALHVPVRGVHANMRQTLRTAGVTTTDAFSMAFYGEQASIETLIRLVEESPSGTLEIMTHPGLVTPDLPSSYREGRAQELAVLTSPEWLTYRNEHGLPQRSF